MDLGEVEVFEVWFMPQNQPHYLPRTLIEGVPTLEAAKAYAHANASSYLGALEIVRQRTTRQLMA